MEHLTLVIGNKNYSSWSLRPWLLLKHLGIPFNEIRIPLYQPESKEALSRWSPSGLVPVLRDGDTVVWDSLAICEYVAESFPEGRVWPQEKRARAQARSVSAEMHSGFAALRRSMPMNCRASRPGEGMNSESEADIARIQRLWKECRAAYGKEGPFLFGGFGAADAMFAPIVVRFRTYGVTLDPTCRAYADTMLGLPAMVEWMQAANAEVERIEMYER